NRPWSALQADEIGSPHPATTFFEYQPLGLHPDHMSLEVLPQEPRQDLPILSVGLKRCPLLHSTGSDVRDYAQLCKQCLERNETPDLGVSNNEGSRPLQGS